MSEEMMDENIENNSSESSFEKRDSDFENKVSLKVNDIDIYLNAFTDDFIKETIIGMLKSIKTSKYGVKEFKNIKIEINNED